MRGLTLFEDGGILGFELPVWKKSDDVLVFFFCLFSGYLLFLFSPWFYRQILHFVAHLLHSQIDSALISNAQHTTCSPIHPCSVPVPSFLGLTDALVRRVTSSLLLPLH